LALLIRFSPALAARLASAFPGRIVGAKDSSGDMEYAAEIARIEDFAVFPSAETALSRARQGQFCWSVAETASCLSGKETKCSLKGSVAPIVAELMPVTLPPNPRQ